MKTLSKTCLTVLVLSAAAYALADTALPASSPGVKQRMAQPGSFTPMASKSNGSGVGMAYFIEGTPAVGSPLAIRLQISSSSDAQIVFRSREGLSLITPEVIDVPAGNSAEYTVTLVPEAEGRYFLNVFSIANGRPSASAIAVQVGTKAQQLKPAGRVMESPSGERVISVPVQ